MPNLNLPSLATVILAVIATVISVLIQNSFGLDADWITGLTVGLVFLSGIGIGPLTGDQFVAALHLPPGVLVVITALMSAGSLAATQIHNVTTASIIVGVITFLSALGFGARVSLAKAQSIVNSGVKE